jgi:diacylglycerol kinase family enzyme
MRQRCAVQLDADRKNRAAFAIHTVLSSMDNSSQKVFVVFNPKAGKDGPAEEVRAALARHFIPPHCTSEIYETTGQEDEDVAAICRAACARGASLVIAAGGDGTLIGVANGLVHSLVPLGTGNDWRESYSFL